MKRRPIVASFGRSEVKFCTAAMLAIVAVLPFGTQPSQAQYAAQLYPYCSQSSASGAETCYYRSRSECPENCISNPWYIGAGRARPYLEGRRALEPRYVRP